MATIDENRGVWLEYDWKEQGEEWSKCWGGSKYLWLLGIFPRIYGFIPTGTILEIAPGYGRISQYLYDYCDKLILVDLAENCINACKSRFKDLPNIEYHVNDGKSLSMIRDRSIDFVFSWDSLVHADSDAIKTYLEQLSYKLTANGIGFIHHSNLGQYRNDVPNPHWRSTDISAEKFAKYATDVGLSCILQEKITWGDVILNDCLSVITPKNSIHSSTTVVMENELFSDMARHASRIAQLYNFTGCPNIRNYL